MKSQKSGDRIGEERCMNTHDCNVTWVCAVTMSQQLLHCPVRPLSHCVTLLVFDFFQCYGNACVPSVTPLSVPVREEGGQHSINPGAQCVMQVLLREMFVEIHVFDDVSELLVIQTIGMGIDRYQRAAGKCRRKNKRGSVRQMEMWQRGIMIDVESDESNNIDGMESGRDKPDSKVRVGGQVIEALSQVAA